MSSDKVLFNSIDKSRWKVYNMDTFNLDCPSNIMHIIQQNILEQLSSKNFEKMTLRDVGILVGEPHPQKIKHHLMQLMKKGLIITDRANGTISLVSTRQTVGSNFVSIPILGSANCGQASIFADERLEGMLKVSKSLIPYFNSDLFAVKAVGNSMNRADLDGKKIENGDYVVIDNAKRTPTTNDYVLSIIDGLANIKKFVNDTQNSQYVLVSESSEEYPPIYIHLNDFVDYMVNGTAIGVIKKPSI